MAKRIFDVTDALSSLYPGVKWAVRGYDYDGIDWMDFDVIQPSREVVEAEVARLQAEYDALEYQRLRKEAYPSIQDQLDKLYHEGYEGWHSSITAIKNKHPKG